MPRISEFYGIVIAMFYNDHEPPHIHAIYGDYRAIVGINPMTVLRGRLPRRAEDGARVGGHPPERADNWYRARERLPLQQIFLLE